MASTKSGAVQSEKHMEIKVFVRFLFFMLLGGIFSANAASFDCGQAKLVAEKAICADQKLSKLDEKIAHEYAKLMTIADPATSKLIQAHQREWLKLRDSPKLLVLSHTNLKDLLSLRLRSLENSVTDSRGLVYVIAVGSADFNDENRPIYLAKNMLGAESFNNWMERMRIALSGESSVSYSVNYANSEFISICIESEEDLLDDQGVVSVVDRRKRNLNWLLKESKLMNSADFFNSSGYKEIVAANVLKNLGINVSGSALDYIRSQISNPENWSFSGDSGKILVKTDRTQERSDAKIVPIEMHVLQPILTERLKAALSR
jgi:uncharacterized protein YecT (DUF1311 family)